MPETIVSKLNTITNNLSLIKTQCDNAVKAKDSSLSSLESETMWQIPDNIKKIKIISQADLSQVSKNDIILSTNKKTNENKYEILIKSNSQKKWSINEQVQILQNLNLNNIKKDVTVFKNGIGTYEINLSNAAASDKVLEGCKYYINNDGVSEGTLQKAAAPNLRMQATNAYTIKGFYAPDITVKNKYVPSSEENSTPIIDLTSQDPNKNPFYSIDSTSYINPNIIAPGATIFGISRPNNIPDPQSQVKIVSGSIMPTSRTKLSFTFSGFSKIPSSIFISKSDRFNHIGSEDGTITTIGIIKISENNYKYIVDGDFFNGLSFGGTSAPYGFTQCELTKTGLTIETNINYCLFDMQKEYNYYVIS